MKDRIIRDSKNLFEHEEKDYEKPEWVGSFWNDNYIEYESSDDGNKALSVEEYLNKIRLYYKWSKKIW